MATTASQLPTGTTTSRSSPAVAGNTSHDMVNGNGEVPSSPAPNAATYAATSKKGKKKAADPNETGKLLAAKINQLELDAAGEKDQEAEIGTDNQYCGLEMESAIVACHITPRLVLLKCLC